MNLDARARREAVAQDKIIAQGMRIADMMALPPAILDGLRPQHRDGLVRALLQREATAALLEIIADALQREATRKPGRPRKQEV